MIHSKTHQHMKWDIKGNQMKQHMRDKTPIEKDTNKKRGYQKKDITWKLSSKREVKKQGIKAPIRDTNWD